MRQIIPLILFICGVATCTARAEESAFDRGAWSIQMYSGFAGANNEKLYSADVGVGYYVLDHVALNLEGAAYYVDQKGPDAAQGEIRLLMRHHLIVKDCWNLFADVGFGISEGSDQVPAAGTRMNFMFRSGLGAGYEIKDNLWLIGGVRYFHLSNAKIEGDDRNPSINGIEGYVGLLFTFK
jgi:hypothetical protein